MVVVQARSARGGMRLRRRTDHERVRHTLRGMPEAPIANTYGEEIMRLRRAMNEAVTDLYAGEPDVARRRLSAALAERWWR